MASKEEMALLDKQGQLKDLVMSNWDSKHRISFFTDNIGLE